MSVAKPKKDAWQAKLNERLIKALYQPDEPAVIDGLLYSGADPNAPAMGYQMLSPLHIAARWAGAETCRLLISAGADQEARDCNGRRPVDVAVVFKNLDALAAFWGDGDQEQGRAA